MALTESRPFRVVARPLDESSNQALAELLLCGVTALVLDFKFSVQCSQHVLLLPAYSSLYLSACLVEESSFLRLQLAHC